MRIFILTLAITFFTASGATAQWITLPQGPDERIQLAETLRLLPSSITPGRSRNVWNVRTNTIFRGIIERANGELQIGVAKVLRVDCESRQVETWMIADIIVPRGVERVSMADIERLLPGVTWRRVSAADREGPAGWTYVQNGRQPGAAKRVANYVCSR